MTRGLAEAACVARGRAWSEGCVVGGVWFGHVWQRVCMAGDVCIDMCGKAATGAGATHPTGMHSCLNLKSVLKLCRVPTCSSQVSP